MVCTHDGQTLLMTLPNVNTMPTHCTINTATTDMETSVNNQQIDRWIDCILQALIARYL